MLVFFRARVSLLVGASFLSFLPCAAVYAEGVNNGSDQGSILGNHLSTSGAWAGSNHFCVECKLGHAASSGGKDRYEHEGMGGGSAGYREVAATELDLSSGATTPATERSTSTTAFRCPDATPVTGALTGAGLINLFVSLGMVTTEKARAACVALARETRSSTPAQDGASFRFSRPLSKGMAGPDVRELQRFLNAQGFVLSEEGDGSPGNETDLYGALTVDAVKRYQRTYSAEILDPEGLSAPSGIFGPSSIKKANELMSARKQR